MVGIIRPVGSGEDHSFQLQVQASPLYTDHDIHFRSVTTSSQKLLDKLERKEKRRTAARGGDLDLDWLSAHGFDEVVEAEVNAAMT